MDKISKFSVFFVFLTILSGALGGREEEEGELEGQHNRKLLIIRSFRSDNCLYFQQGDNAGNGSTISLKRCHFLDSSSGEVGEGEDEDGDDLHDGSPLRNELISIHDESDEINRQTKLYTIRQSGSCITASQHTPTLAPCSNGDNHHNHPHSHLEIHLVPLIHHDAQGQLHPHAVAFSLQFYSPQTSTTTTTATSNCLGITNNQVTISKCEFRNRNFNQLWRFCDKSGGCSYGPNHKRVFLRGRSRAAINHQGHTLVFGIVATTLYWTFC